MSDTNKAVFLSYASQDAEAAKRIADCLRATGVEVWFDQSELVGGDSWDAKIRGQIASCALFVPVISAETQARGEGYFRLEWKLAVDRSHLMAHDQPFLLPVVIDATTDSAARVPPEFRTVQWTRLPGGDTPEKFCARVQLLLGGSSAEDGRQRTEVRAVRSESSSRPTRRPWLISATVGVALVAATVIWHPWKSSDSDLPARPELARGERAESAERAPHSSSLAPSSDKSIAVLPFENRSASGEDAAFLSDGIHEDLINTLSRVPGLKVMSRTAVQRFKVADASMADIAAALKVSHVVEAGVQRAGNQVRINVQLVQTSDGQTVWSEHYDRVLTADGIFALQEEITKSVAAALKLQLDPSQSKALVTGATKSLPAYEAFLKGRQAWSTNMASGAAEAIAQFKRAVELDPNFALAHGAMAEAYITMGNSGQDSPANTFPLAKGAAERALAIDPRCTQALTALGEYAFHYEWDWAKSERLLRQALAVNPNYANAYGWLAGHLSMLNRGAEAKMLEKREADLEPERPLTKQRHDLDALLEAKRYDEAVAAARQIADQRPGSFVGSYILGAALREAGRFEESVRVLEKVVMDFPDVIQLYPELAISCAGMGETAKARGILGRLTAMKETRYVSPLVFATVATAAGDRDMAFSEIERAIQVHDPMLPSIGMSDDFESIKGDPRFRDLLKRLKLDSYFPETTKS